MTPIFDRALLRTRLQRAQKDPAVFLWEKIAAALQDRLFDIKRDFDQVVEIAPQRLVLEETFLQKKKIGQAFFLSTLSGLGDAVIDEEFLPLKTASLDGLISLGSLHWANDLPGALIQARQALRPDGVFLAAMIGGETLYELRAVLAEVEARQVGGLSPRISPFAALPDLAALMQRAGFALPVVDNEKLTVTYANSAALIGDLRRMGQGNAVLRKNNKILSRGFWLDAEKTYRENYATKDGRLIATVEVLYLIGWSPDASQQQPLRRGSATHRLSDILKTDEIGLEDFA